MAAPVTIERLNHRDARAWLRCMRNGELEAAWLLSDRILERTGARRDFNLPRHLQQVWDGTPLAGRRVLIRCYHGLGDTIQFIRYAALVRAICPDVTVWAQPLLLPLLGTAAGIDRLLPLHDGAPGIDYDVDVEVMELPYVFRSTWETIPREVPYLTASPATSPHGPTPRVGLAWRSGNWDPRRSVPFQNLSTLLDLQGVAWYSLQHGATSDEHHPNLRPLDTAGLLRMAECMRALDLVISIDSMPAHLAGALAVPVWTLLAREADWRWMEGCQGSPWYPTMRLFRQPRAGAWLPVLDEVRRLLVRSTVD